MNTPAALACVSLLALCSIAGADNGKNKARVAQTIHNIHSGAVARAESDAKAASAKQTKGRRHHRQALRPMRHK